MSIRIGVQLPAWRSRAHSSSPGEPGQHHVEDQRVVGVLGGEPLAVGAVERDVDGVPLVLEPAAYGARHVLVVLDHQDPHLPRIPLPAEAPLNLR